MQALIGLTISLFLTAVSARAEEPDSTISPKQILDKVDDLYRGGSSHAKMTMRVRTAHWSREMSFEMWTKGKKKSLVRILSPKKEKGTATLMSDDNLWNYLPKVKKIIKIPSSMMGNSWMGSHFTNDDLVKESRMAEDYDLEVGFQGLRDGQRVIEVTCTPKKNAAVVWGKVIVQVKVEGYQPNWVRYFDEDLELARTLTYAEVKKFGDRSLPAVMRVVPADKPQEVTEVELDEIRFDLEIKDDVFSIRNLQR